MSGKSVTLRTTIFSIILCLYTGVSHVALASENRIMVLPFQNSSGDERLDALGEGFSDLLLSTLSTYEEIEIIERENLDRVINELSLSLSGMENKHFIRLGKLLQANRLLRGGFVSMGADIKINAHVFDSETTQLLFSFENTGDLNNIHELATTLAQQIATKLAHGAEPTKLVVADERPQASLHYMKGLGAYYSGLYDHAVAEFMQVLDFDFSHSDARYWLAKSYLGSGENIRAKIEFERFIEKFPEDERGRRPLQE